MVDEQKKVKAYYNNFKYEGLLLETTELTYKIHDSKKDMIVILPIANTVLVFEEGDK